MQHDSHFIKWIETKFGVEVWFTGMYYRARVGSDWSYLSTSAWGALCDYASCYNGNLLYQLVEYEG